MEGKMKHLLQTAAVIGLCLSTLAGCGGDESSINSQLEYFRKIVEQEPLELGEFTQDRIEKK